jgi:uncharacterized protein (DUF58 family)
MTEAMLRAFGLEGTPDRPGPGPMPDALLRALELTIGRRVEGLLAGDHRSALLGGGTELAQVRPYVPGDDVRQIDWAVTARTRTPHVRVQLAERVLVTWIVLDASASMAFGTADRRKDDVALGASMALGHAASVRGNRVGLVVFGEGENRVLPPRQGRAGLVGVLTTLGQETGGSRGSASLAEALATVAAVARQRALVAIVSDFRGPRDWRVPLLDVAGRHDVLAVEVRDAREQELPAIGELALVDPETGERIRIDTNDAGLRARFAAHAADDRRQVAAELARTGSAHVVVGTEGDWLRQLASFLRRRRR